MRRIRRWQHEEEAEPSNLRPSRISRPMSMKYLLKPLMRRMGRDSTTLASR